MGNLILWYSQELFTPENQKKKRELEIDHEVMKKYWQEFRAYPPDIPSETEEALATPELHDKTEASTEADATVDSTSGIIRQYALRCAKLTTYP